MTEIDYADIALRLLGVFYAFAGVVAARAGVMSRLLDTALAAIEGIKTSHAETARALWMVCAGIVILAGGVALMLGTHLAAWLFIVSALAQGVYIAVVAPYFLDPSDPPDAAGRKQTTNAFVLYLAATAFVLWAYTTGRLHDWRSLPWSIVVLGGGAVAGYAGSVLIRFFKPLWK